MNNDIKLIEKYIPIKKQKKAIKKLDKNYPVQYIIGNVDFYNINLDVNKHVLIPRFETEFLVEKLIKLIKTDNPCILDIGTGSGAIAISLKKNISCEVDASDISSKALKVAKKNAVKNNVEINYIKDDITNSKINKKYDVIVSNPPYVPYNSEVTPNTKYEPKNAIYADDNGMFYYKVIIDFAKKNLNKNGILAFEIGYNQGEDITKIAKKHFQRIWYENDLNNQNRYFFIINE